MDSLVLPQRVAIVGSRDFPNPALVRDFVALLPEDTIVISGGARGVDALAAQAARERGLRVEVYLPDWERHPRRGGVLRNAVVMQHSEHVVAFWDGISPGTKDAVAQARREGLGTTVFRADSLLPTVEGDR